MKKTHEGAAKGRQNSLETTRAIGGELVITFTVFGVASRRVHAGVHSEGLEAVGWDDPTHASRSLGPGDRRRRARRGTGIV